MIKVKNHSSVWFWLLTLVLIIPTFYCLMKPGFFPMQDDLQAFRIYEMDKCFADGQIPCRWVPDAGYGYGYPQFNYYPPAVYYLGELLHKIGFQFIDAVKILFAGGYILSALAIFFLVSELWGNFPALTAAVVYTFVPYKAVEVYVRGAMSEFWAMVFYPLIFWAVYKLIKTLKNRYLALLAVFLSLLLTTHLLMSMIFALPAIVWTLYWLIKEKKLKEIWRVIAAVLLGVGLAAFFIFPVLFERKFVHIETMTMGYFGYLQHFVSLDKLFLSQEWGYGSSGFPNEKLNLSTGLVQWVFGLITVLTAAFYVFIKKDKKKRETSVLVLVLGTVELLTLFMIHVRSSFIWKALPFLAILQFPWRFLTISVFLLAVLAGAGVKLMPKFKKKVGLLVIAAAMIMNYSYFTPKDWLYITDADKFSGESWQKQLTISIFDYLPIYAKFPPISPAPAVPEVLEGEASFLEYTKGSDFQRGLVKSGEGGALIRAPIFDFPGMITKIDNQIVPHFNNDCRGEEFCLGLVSFRVPAGEHRIEVELKDTRVRKIGNYLSLFGILVTLYLLVRRDKNDKQDI